MADDAEYPKCPACQELMRLAVVIPKFAGYPEIHTFRCGACGEVLAKEVKSE